MRDIYSRAQRTLICLDIKPSINSKEVHWTIVAYEAILVIADWSERNKFEREWTGSKYGTLEFPPLKLAHWAAINRLFSCEWFRRVWVIQEAVLPPESIFIVDQQEWRWETIGIACLRLADHLVDLAGIINISSFPALFQAYNIWLLLARKRDGAVFPLYKIRAHFGPALATDPRHLIYGLLGVSKEQSLLKQQIRSGFQGRFHCQTIRHLWQKFSRTGLVIL